MSVLETKGVSMEFPGVKALRDVDFKIETGKIQALVGANGAGKSTLMKVLAGANPGYTGDVFIDGRLVSLRSPAAAKAEGIHIVYQEADAALIPSLSVAENIALDELAAGKGSPFINRSRMRAEAERILKRLDCDIDVGARVGELSLAKKQIVLIARALADRRRFLLLDEPTAPLSQAETEALFRLCGRLAYEEDMAVVFISHRLEEVLQICDGYTVMLDGGIVETAPATEDTTTERMIEKMLGGAAKSRAEKRAKRIGEVALSVKHLTDAEGGVRDVSLYVRRGEVVGIAGLAGAGKSELCKAIFGASRKIEGNIEIDGKPVKIKSPADAVRHGIGLAPEERRKEGLLISRDAEFNLSLACLKKLSRLGFIDRKKSADNAEEQIKRLSVKTPSIRRPVELLSGGNQQKLVIGKWLAADCEIYLFDEPTKGIDVGAKAEILNMIRELADAGRCAVYASCENSELLSVADRIYVMYDGAIAAELDAEETSEEEITYYALGGKEKYYGT